MERMKTCFKCGQQKELSEFYAHKMMADGHLNKCKDCTKADATRRIEEKQSDPSWLAAERARCRDKQARYRKNGTAVKPSRATKTKWRKANPAKVRAQKTARRAKRDGILREPTHCDGCRKAARLEMHHPDYSQPLTVQWLCFKCHGKTRHK